MFHRCHLNIPLLFFLHSLHTSEPFQPFDDGLPIDYTSFLVQEELKSNAIHLSLWFCLHLYNPIQLHNIFVLVKLYGDCQVSNF